MQVIFAKFQPKEQNLKDTLNKEVSNMIRKKITCELLGLLF